jgi:phage shock protein E
MSIAYRAGRLAVVVLFVTIFTPLGVQAQHSNVSLHQISQQIRANQAILLDVREKAEWDDGHLAGARLLPLSTLQAGVNPTELARYLPKDRVIYCYCAAGARTPQAAALLRQYGYQAYPLRQGYDDLVGAGFPRAK